ncbi:hypothetical protein NQ317_009078, partial [Molorchus minor]
NGDIFTDPVAGRYNSPLLPGNSTPTSGYTHVSIEKIKQNRIGSTTKTYRSTVAYREYDDDLDDGFDNEPESSQDRAPTLVNQNYQLPTKSTLQPAYIVQPRPNAPVARYTSSPAKPIIRRGEVSNTRRLFFVQEVNKLEEEEKEQPDKLSVLLPESKFTCNGRNTGYYADEGLGCEVFHYCQDNARHSWVCPDGFTFHQVHLICMPPGGDNICEKSSDYHFVNDFLYKPVNLEEYQQSPNVTLRYSDRYYPDAYRQYREEEVQAPTNYKHSARVVQPQRLQNTVAPRPVTIRPQPTAAQVFRSPEEVNIPLQARRPVQQIQYTTAKYLDDDY